MERLDKFLSNQTEFSRKDARKCIFCGRVEVNGVIEKRPDRHIDPQTDKICCDGREVGYQKFVYLVMHKPAGILSASTDKKRRTVVDLVPQAYKNRELFPVGRLDKDTTGLLILTDDGVLAHQIISPKSKVEKVYTVTVDKPVNSQMQKAFTEGVCLADGTLCCPAKLLPISDTVAQVILTEGKYHQVKRMLGVFDVGVVALHRERIGALCLQSGQAPGECFSITKEDLIQRVGIKPNGY